MWKDYVVLAVEKEAVAEVEELTLSRSITGVVSMTDGDLGGFLGGAFGVPWMGVKIPGIDEEYLKKRRDLFFDRSRKYRLYYVPEAFWKKAALLVEDLRAAGVRASLPRALSGERKSVPPAFFWTLFALGAVLLFFQWAMMRRLSRHRGWVTVFAHSPFGASLTTAVLVVNLAAARETGLLLLGVFLAAAVLLRGEAKWRVWRDSRFGAFSPVAIRPAALSLPAALARRGKAGRGRLAVLAGATAAVLGIVVLWGRGEKVLSGRGLYLPAPTGYTYGTLEALDLWKVEETEKGEEVLWDLADYVHWAWRRFSFPYRRLPAEGIEKGTSMVTMNAYREEKGALSETTPLEKRLDKAFADRALWALDTIPVPAIEKVLRSQGGFRRITWIQVGVE